MTNVLPLQKNSWPTYAHTQLFLLGWTVSCSQAPPLDQHHATSIFHIRAVQAPCMVPCPSGLPPAWVWAVIIPTVRSICLLGHPPFPFTLCLPQAHTTLTMLSTAKDSDLLLPWATNDKHLLTCSKECFGLFSVFWNYLLLLFGLFDESWNMALLLRLAWHKCRKEEEIDCLFLWNQGTQVWLQRRQSSTLRPN